MQKKVGKAFISLIKPMVIADNGRMMMYFKGTVRADYTGIGVEPIYEVLDIELPAERDGSQPLEGNKVWVPVSNVSGIVWAKDGMEW